jgi:hypothetical protein
MFTAQNRRSGRGEVGIAVAHRGATEVAVGSVEWREPPLRSSLCEPYRYGRRPNDVSGTASWEVMA